MHSNLLSETPSGSIGQCSENSWVNADLLKTIHAKSSIISLVLLLIDNHSLQ